MAIENPIYPLLGGDVYAAHLNTDDTTKDEWSKLGNFTVKVKQNSDKKELISLMSESYGDAVAAVYLKKPSEITLEGNGITSVVLGLLFGGDVTDESVTGSTAIAEAHTMTAVNTGIMLDYNKVSNVLIAKSTDTAQACTFQDTGDTVTKNTHGLNNGDRVYFTSITTTTGISINTAYYVVNKAANTFQVSLTVGGSAIALTTDGSGEYRKLLSANAYSIEDSTIGLVNVVSDGTTPVAVNDVLDVTYTYGTIAAKKIVAGTKSSFNVAIKAKLEDQNTGELWILDCKKLTLTSNSEISLIGEDFMSVSLTGTPVIVNGENPLVITKDV